MSNDDEILSWVAGILMCSVISIVSYFIGVSEGGKDADKRWQVEAVNHHAGQMIVPEGEHAFVFRWNDELSDHCRVMQKETN